MMGSSEYNHRAQTAARGVEPGMIKKKRKIKGRGLIWKLTSRERENTTRALQGMFKREKIKEGQETRAVENRVDHSKSFGRVLRPFQPSF
jgi:hypothetical protein